MCRRERVVQFDRRKQTVTDADGVWERFGVGPASVPDWLALVGDSADGFPGLKGWGPRSASGACATTSILRPFPTTSAPGTTRVRRDVRGAQTLGGHAIHPTGSRHVVSRHCDAAHRPVVAGCGGGVGVARARRASSRPCVATCATSRSSNRAIGRWRARRAETRWIAPVDRATIRGIFEGRSPWRVSIATSSSGEAGRRRDGQRPARRADVAVSGGRIVAVGEGLGWPATRRLGPGGGARVHRHPHPLRRPGLLGPVAHPVVVPRRDDGGRRQLRVLHRPHPPGRRRRCWPARCSTSRT